MTLTLSLSSGFALARDETPVALRNRKAQALLIYLAITGQPQFREHLATLLWGDRFDDQARNSLRQALFVLRKTVGDEVLTGNDPIGLTKGALQIEEGTTLLPGFSIGVEGFDNWLGVERERLRAKSVATLLDKAQRSGVLAHWREVLTLDPLNETAMGGVMQTLAGQGRRAEALTAFERFRALFRNDLDAEPSKALEDLAETLRHGAPDRQQEEPPPEMEPVPPAAPVHFLVATFEDFGGGDLSSFCAAELPGEICLRSQDKQIAVMPSAGLMKLRTDAPEDPLSEARLRGATGIVTGTVRQQADRVRVSVRVLSVERDTVIWEDVFVFPADQVFDAIGQFAQNVTLRLTVLLGREQDPAAAMRKLREHSEDDASFLRDLHGLVWHAFYWSQTRQIMRDGRAFLETLAPTFARSPEFLTYLAAFTFHAAHLDDGKDRLDKYRTARALNEKALALNPGFGHALRWKTAYCAWLGDLDAAEQAHQSLSARDRSIQGYRGMYAVSQVLACRFDTAFPLLEEAIDTERGTANLFYRHAVLGLGLFLSGNDAAALVSAENGLTVGREFFLSHLVRIAALECLGRHDAAVRALAEMRADYRDPTLSEFSFLPIADETRKSRLLEALRRAGMPD